MAGPWWLQVYVLRDRGVTAEVVRRAVESGARALVLTVDTPVVGSKRRDTDFDLTGLDTLVPAQAVERDDDGLLQAPDVTYDDIGWLRDLAGDLPVAVKGVVRADDARAAVDAGASAVWVSNHGGRQLDGCVPTAAALPEVVEAVGDDVEVYVDGGIRHGRDVLRALALGARAVAVGRPVLWALAADGGPGVRDLLTDFAADLAETLQLAGVRSPAEVTRDLVVRARVTRFRGSSLALPPPHRAPRHLNHRRNSWSVGVSTGNYRFVVTQKPFRHSWGACESCYSCDSSPRTWSSPSCLSVPPRSSPCSGPDSCRPASRCWRSPSSARP